MKSNKKQNCCLAGRHYSNTKKMVEYEKINRKTQKLFKFIKGNCCICSLNESQVFAK